MYQFNGTVLAMNALFLHMLLYFVRNKTSIIIVMYSGFIFFSLSLWNTSKALTIFRKDKRSYGSVCNGIQRFDSSQFYRRKRIFAFIIDERKVQTRYKHAWIWIAIESVHKAIVGIHIYEERNMFVAKVLYSFFS